MNIKCLLTREIKFERCALTWVGVRGFSLRGVLRCTRLETQGDRRDEISRLECRCNCFTDPQFSRTGEGVGEDHVAKNIVLCVGEELAPDLRITILPEGRTRWVRWRKGETLHFLDWGRGRGRLLCWPWPGAGLDQLGSRSWIQDQRTRVDARGSWDRRTRLGVGGSSGLGRCWWSISKPVVLEDIVGRKELNTKRVDEKYIHKTLCNVPEWQRGLHHPNSLHFLPHIPRHQRNPR